jgi:SnoaL-like domain
MTDQLPGPAAGYVRTVNGRDPAGFIALFADDAVVDDAGRVIRGREAIRAWAAGDIFAADVTLAVLDAGGDENEATITAKVDGTFDRTGLPEPLIMMFEIAAQGGTITKLTCRLAETSRAAHRAHGRGRVHRVSRTPTAEGLSRLRTARHPIAESG